MGTASGSNQGNSIAVSGSGTVRVRRAGIGLYPDNNSVTMTSGGVLEVGSGGVSLALSGNTLNNSGGVLQFLSASPSISIAAGSQILMNNGTLSYKGVTGANMNANTSGSGVGQSAIAWSGSNSFRLDGSAAG